MTLLHFIQAEQKYISNEAIEWVAEKLEIQPINVLEVVTFFPYYRQEKLGKVHVRVCRTLSCALMEYAECLAACGTGPVVLVDEDLYENLNRVGTVEPMVEEITKRIGMEPSTVE